MNWLTANSGMISAGLWVAGVVLAAARWSRNVKLEAAATAFVAVGAISCFALGVSSAFWAGPLLLSVAYGAFVAVRGIRREWARVLSSRTLQLVCAVGLAPIGALTWAAINEPNTSTFEEVARRQVDCAAIPDPTPVAVSAYTDRDQSIPLYTRGNDDLPMERIYQTERRLGNIHAFGMIRTAEPETSYNCHGWVFTGGRYWVRNESVERILADNDYSRVETPVTGDLIVYRDESGKVLHTGIVRMTGDSGIIVESKWGPMGRFLHPVHSQPYGEYWTYYRSHRSDHVLKGFESIPAPIYSSDGN